MTEHKYQVLIVGSGAAAYNAAHWAKSLNESHSEKNMSFAIITEGRKKGTSRNTGSDKQTYYKLSISGNEPDSVHSMAETLFSGGGMDGDVALCEAAGSVPSFLKLANLGIPFPTNDYGEFVGYKTDHDPFHRATSAGPLTSKYMVEHLESQLDDVSFFDGYLAFRVLKEENQVKGVLCLKIDDGSFHLFHGNYVIWCTGAPASSYFYSVFPKSQTGMTGALLDAGVLGKNLGEWQYGLASVKFRWNVSGSYQQVIPRYFSVDEEGNEYDFLDNIPNSLDFVFLKGYQWPFDVRKIQNSSLIDKLVYEEFIQGRKVYMDFRVNPKQLDFNLLSKETYNYLEKSGILFGSPLERLKKMNPLAIEIYKNNHIDLETEPLEVMVCAQHHNGGVEVDTNWETAISGLYACGEVAGTLGVYRPGGSALNSSQVGSMRAINHIFHQKNKDLKENSAIVQEAESIINTLSKLSDSNKSISTHFVERQKKMSQVGAHMRNISKMEEFYQECTQELECYWTKTTLKAGELPLFLKNYDTLLTQCALLNAMILCGNTFGSRGSACLEDTLAEETANLKVYTKYENEQFTSFAQTVVPIPTPNNWFETVWADYRKRREESSL